MSHSFGKYRYVPKGRFKHIWGPEFDGKKKKCTVCKQVKLITGNFTLSKRKNGTFQVRPMCRDCARVKQKEREGSFGHLAAYLKSSYGLSLQDYFDISYRQGAKCAICRVPESDLVNHPNRNSRRLQIDHCHNSNEVRGLLCADCNVAIGRLHDDPDFALRAYEYLKAWAERKKAA